ncbi:unnamed protein product, partial [Adineta steineri]
MSSSSYLITWLIIVSVANAVNVSYNRPKLCPNATWDQNGTTVANETVIGHRPHALFIDNNNNLYVANHERDKIVRWLKGHNESKDIVSAKLSEHSRLFVTTNGDIYFETENPKGQIYKWTESPQSCTCVANFGEPCRGLFIDINNTIYCSVHDKIKVISTSLNNSCNTLTTAAGEDSSRSLLYKLKDPHGIFIDINLNIYLAEAGNGRIQLFSSGQENGATVAGCGFPQNLDLNNPTDVILDADGNLYIAERGQNRIVRIGPSGYKYILGKQGTNKKLPDELNQPYSIRFDSYGSIYVADTHSDRIQKFTLATNSCNSTTTASFIVGSAATTKCFIEGETQIATTIKGPTTTTIKEQTTTVSNALTNTYLSTEKINTTTSIQPYSTTTFVEEVTTISNDENEQLSNIFYPHACENSTEIGSHCDVSNAPCNQLQPCLNNGTCSNNDTNVHGYFCLCPEGFNGTECQLDFR